MDDKYNVNQLPEKERAEALISLQQAGMCSISVCLRTVYVVWMALVLGMFRVSYRCCTIVAILDPMRAGRALTAMADKVDFSAMAEPNGMKQNAKIIPGMGSAQNAMNKSYVFRAHCTV